MKREDLVKALRIVMPGVEKSGSNVLEGAETFVMDGEWIKTFNDHLSVSFPLKTGLSCAVRAEEFYSVISKMAGLMVSLKFAKNILTADDGNTTLEMTTTQNQVGQYIENFALGDLKWKDLPKDFFDGLNQCIFSVANRPEYGVLTAIFIGEKDIISSDNFRISWFNMSEKMDTVLLPLGSAKELVKIPNISKYCIGESWAHFMDAEGVTFSSRIMMGDYPATDIADLFSGDFGNEYQFPEGMVAAIERTDVMSSVNASSNESYITVKKVKDQLTLIGNRAYGTIKDKIKIDAKTFPDGIELNIAPKFLKAILGHTRKFHIKDGSLLVFTAPKFRHIVSTAKTDAEE
jgi:hypothetical protein